MPSEVKFTINIKPEKLLLLPTLTTLSHGMGDAREGTRKGEEGVKRK